jgi:hypothetical protein
MQAITTVTISCPLTAVCETLESIADYPATIITIRTEKTRVWIELEVDDAKFTTIVNFYNTLSPESPDAKLHLTLGEAPMHIESMQRRTFVTPNEVLIDLSLREKSGEKATPLAMRELTAADRTKLYQVFDTFRASARKVGMTDEETRAIMVEIISNLASETEK